MTTITASQLQPGTVFKLGLRKRKWHTVKSIRTLNAAPGRVPAEHDGKLLIVLDGCGQLLFSPTDEIITE